MSDIDVFIVVSGAEGDECRGASGQVHEASDRLLVIVECHCSRAYGGNSTEAADESVVIWVRLIPLCCIGMAAPLLYF